jgi:hypothetical protein
MAEVAAGLRPYLGLLLLALLLKAGALPLFAWLPASYPVLPPAVLALVGGLLTKVAAYVLLSLTGQVFAVPELWLENAGRTAHPRLPHRQPDRLPAARHRAGNAGRGGGDGLFPVPQHPGQGQPVPHRRPDVRRRRALRPAPHRRPVCGAPAASPCCS